MAGANYGDIDFEEINEATGLAADEIKCLKVVNTEMQQMTDMKQLLFFRSVLIFLTPRNKIIYQQMILAKS